VCYKNQRKYKIKEQELPLYGNFASNISLVIHTEVIIAGQGLAGSLLACELYQKGIDFRIFDRPFSENASNAAGGLYYPLAARKLKEIKGLHQLYTAMIQRFEACEKWLGDSFLYESNSAKLCHPSEVPVWEEARNSHLGHLINSIDPEFQMNGLKTGYAAAIVAQSGYVNLNRFTALLARTLQEKQLLVPEHVDLLSIEAGEKRLVVNQYYSAEKLVFCQGPAHQDNPWFPKVVIGQNKGELIDIYAPGLDDRYTVRGEGIFILPLGEGNFRVGATFSHKVLDWQPTLEGRMELTGKLDRMLTAKYEVIRHWAGIRPTTYDRLPVVGQHPELQRLFIFNGLGSRGVLQAPYYAELMANKLTGDKANWDQSIDVGRFA